VPSEWLRRRKRDQFHRLAKQRGYRSRASFKLFQINRTYRFLARNDYVLDLGAAPGGWLQAARQAVGTGGLVVGVDKQPIESLPQTNIITITADISQDGIVDLIRQKSSGRFDVILSDLSPNVSGVWEVDHARQIELARCALRCARELLKPSGNLLVKVFQGSELREFQLEMKSSFRFLRIVKPPATRRESAELYFLGLSYIVEDRSANVSQ
jgi:23S rRNA (uridine2552-2'-O)-methyltransferase